ncbi:phosphatidylinositol mannoside acyltransferase [Timonella sp. A28]|uniref:phosphatidylinositol mannoside acyltransferase n=1 Tax=Timonella sp. A28 TaxID=3442640 RepID=UPI003EBDDC49
MSKHPFSLAWQHAYKIPAPIYRTLFSCAADLTWLLRKGGVTQLEKNLQRVAPQLTAKQVRKLARQGMRSYMRYFSEVFVLTHLTPEQVRHRVRLEGEVPVLAAINEGKSPILALTHQGNWDLAGVFASAHIAPVLTVAERLKPDEVYQEFLKFRAELGMTILTAGDSGVFRQLLRAAKGPSHLICLLADRDLSASGIEVNFFGHTARVAAGPAALAVASDAPLFPVGVTYEKITGKRRKQAGASWGIVLKFYPPVDIDRTQTKEEQINATTQKWVTALEESIAQHPEDWHMLQKVFIEDLDPERYARITKEAHDGAA